METRSVWRGGQDAHGGDRLEVVLYGWHRWCPEWPQRWGLGALGRSSKRAQSGHQDIVRDLVSPGEACGLAPDVRAQHPGGCSEREHTPPCTLGLLQQQRSVGAKQEPGREEAVLLILMRKEESLKEGSCTWWHQGDGSLSASRGRRKSAGLLCRNRKPIHFQKQPMCGIHVLTRLMNTPFL